MATRYAVGNGLWSDTTSVWSDTDGGAPGSFVPVDGDTFVICAAAEVQVDVDQSAWTGMAETCIVRGGVAPGMIYWKDGTSGTLKFRTAATLNGTTSTNKGRILANSDGVWGNTTPLGYATKQLIMFETSALFNAISIDYITRPTEPIVEYVRCYGTKYDFNGATDVDIINNTIDLGTPPPAEGTLVCVTGLSGGVIPGGFTEDCQYYVRAINGNMCKLSYTNNDANIINITHIGSGTCTVFTGFASGSATVNVLEDITGDNWTNGDAVCLANMFRGSADTQMPTVITIGTGSFVLSEIVNSNQQPGARIALSSRNCSILSSCITSTYVIYQPINCIFGEVRGTIGGNGFGSLYMSGNTYSVIANFATAVYSPSGYTIRNLLRCSFGLQYGNLCTIHNAIGCGTVISNTVFSNITSIMGCTTGFNGGAGNCAISIMGCNTAITNAANIVVITIMQTVEALSGGSDYWIKNLYGNLYDITSRAIKSYSMRNADVPIGLSWNGRNTSLHRSYFFSSDHAGVFGAYHITQNFGDVTKVTAGSGTPTPNQRSGGNADLLELSNLQTNLSTDNYMIAWDTDQVKIHAQAGTSKTYRFYVQSTFDLAAGELALVAEYYDSATDIDTATITNVNAITTRSSIDDWSQYIDVTINPARTSLILFNLFLYKYSAGGRVYIDPQVVIS